MALTGAGLQVVHADGGDAAAWAAERAGALHEVVARHGAVMVRGLDLPDAGAVERVSRSLVPHRLVEREAFAPRRPYAEGVSSSSEWPPDEPMCMHHELSYALEVPRLILFGCLTAPATGGATAVADSHEVLEALPPAVVEPFRRHGWLLTRTYHQVGVPWRVAFGTEDRDAVDAYCRSHAIAHEWRADGSLRTRQRRAAIVAHPVTGRPVWCNQIAFLNEWTLDPDVRQYLVDVYGGDGLPYNTALGDGTPIDAGTVRAINETYQRATVREPWRSGDLLLVDNVRMAHAREPYDGPREVVVVMGDPTRLPGHLL